MAKKLENIIKNKLAEVRKDYKKIRGFSDYNKKQTLIERNRKNRIIIRVLNEILKEYKNTQDVF